MPRVQKSGSATAPHLPAGLVLYAIGDIHGRQDLFDGLIDQILAEAPTWAGRRLVIVLLGDYIDRGPASAGVVERICQLRLRSDIDLYPLKGNHEDAMLQFLSDPRAGAGWVAHGGAETLASYGVAPPRLRTNGSGWLQTREALLAAMPARHLALLNNLDVSLSLGDYFFVHAGVRPGVPFEAQSEHDLLWIRDEFLSFRGRWSKVVVHGHTPMEAAVLTPARISIDTGAYATGVLTGLRLMDDQREIISYSKAINGRRVRAGDNVRPEF